MPKLALLTAHGGPIELAEFPLSTPAPGTDPSALVYGNKSVRGVMFYDPVTLAIGLTFLQHTSFPFDRLMPDPFHLADVNAAFASANAGLVPRGALVP